MLNSIDHLVEYYGDRFLKIHSILQSEVENNAYLKGHLARMIASIFELNEIVQEGFSVLELGYSDFFHKYLNVNVSDWDYTVYPAETSAPRGVKITDGGASNNPQVHSSKSIEINFEEQQFPLDLLPAYDVIVCTEVIEHMDRDPMWLMSEINSLLKINGLLFLTTPNSVGARIFWKVAHGYHPSFFLKYSRNRNPYRHNYEYTPQNVNDLISCSGFQIEKQITLDTFEDPLISGYDSLSRCGFSMLNRGDNIFAVARKVGEVNERYPSFLYA